jgi:hypothetical protein
VILNGLEERRRYVILLFDKLEYCALISAFLHGAKKNRKIPLLLTIFHTRKFLFMFFGLVR